MGGGGVSMLPGIKWNVDGDWLAPTFNNKPYIDLSLFSSLQNSNGKSSVDGDLLQASILLVGGGGTEAAFYAE